MNVPLLKWAVGVFGAGLFLGAITFVNAYVAQGALASGRSTFLGDSLRRLGLGLIVASLLLFLLGVCARGRGNLMHAKAGKSHRIDWRNVTKRFPAR